MAPRETLPAAAEDTAVAVKFGRPHRLRRIRRAICRQLPQARLGHLCPTRTQHGRCIQNGQLRWMHREVGPERLLVDSSGSDRTDLRSAPLGAASCGAAGTRVRVPLGRSLPARPAPLCPRRDAAATSRHETTSRAVRCRRSATGASSARPCLRSRMSSSPPMPTAGNPDRSVVDTSARTESRCRARDQNRAACGGASRSCVRSAAEVVSSA